MTDVTARQGQESVGLSAADERLLGELTERARAGGLQLTGEGGLLGKLTKMVIEGAWRGSWTTISAMASTMRQAVMAGIPATGTGLRR